MKKQLNLVVFIMMVFTSLTFCFVSGLQAQSYTIVASAGTGGSINPSGDVIVADGENQEFVVTADIGYHIEQVLVDGLPPEQNGPYSIVDSSDFGDIYGTIFYYTFFYVTENHTIEATFAIDTFTITPTAGSNGSISTSDPVTVNYWEDQTFTIKPDIGYHVLNVIIDSGGENPQNIGPVTEYTFSDVTSDHTIDATFEIDTFTITATAGPNGVITPPDEVTVNYGESQTFYIIPDSGCRTVDVKVDGISQGVLTEYTFDNVTDNHSIEATFAKVYTIYASADNNGSINPDGEQIIDEGLDQKFTITPNAGYRILDVTIDNTSQGALTEYTFYTVTDNHVISATFQKVYTIVATPAKAGTEGKIEPSGDVIVDEGADQTFVVTAGAGYHIEQVFIDGSPFFGDSPESIASNSNVKAMDGDVFYHTFYYVTENHTIDATFAIDTFTITPTAGDNGSISPSDPVTVNYGADQSFIITSDIGYHISSILVDGQELNGPATPSAYISPYTYTFTNVQEDHTIEATFDIDAFTITTTSGTGGSITSDRSVTPSDYVIVYYGDSKTLTITPDPGYRILDVIVDSISQGALTEYTFTNVTEDHIIEATFQKVYIIYASADNNGSIEPSGEVLVNEGSDQKFTITPNTGYRILNVMVDNTSLGALTEHTFTNVTSSHYISATFQKVYTIVATAGTGGSINPSGNVLVDEFNDQTFTITADPGYHIEEVLVDGSPIDRHPPAIYGSSVEAMETDNFSYTFYQISEDHTIDATFDIDTFTITPTSGANGSISPSSQVTVNYDNNQKFTISPDTGYHILDVMVDNVSQGSVGEYTFTNVTSNHTIEVTFAIDTSTITPTAGANGNISPSSQVTVNYGDNQKFTITADAGHHISEVLVDGSPVTVTNPNIFDYTFTGVTANHTISASFAINDYTIVSSSGANGIISPSGSVPVSHGGNQKFTITPDTGYHILDVMVDNVSQGSVTEYTFTNVQSNHTINATFAIDTFTITPTSGANGSISPSSQVTVNYGDNQKFTITADAGHHISEVLVDGSSVTVTNPNVFDYTFTGVTANHTISASFAINDYTIVSTSGANGSISPSGSVPISHGGNQKFTITPDTGYHILDVMVDNVSQGSVGEYTFTNVTSNHTISATFAIDTFTITPTTGANGSISPSSQVTVNYGDNQKITIAPDTGYHILDVIVDNISQGSVTEYTFTNVQSNHTIDATFAIDTFTITPTSGANGSISPSSQVTVNYGDNQKFTITAYTGHHISKVLVDGSPVTVTNPNVFDYTFTGVIANHTISASFAINDYTIVSSSGANGIISPSGSVPISHGSNQKFIITPGTGYHILDVMVDNVYQGSVSEYTFTNVQSNHTINATFAIDTFTITPTAGNNGSITPSTQVTVNYGDNQKITIAPDTGYHILDVIVDNISQGSVTEYTFTNVQSNHTIDATFAIDIFTITPTSGANGSISPSSQVTVDYGDNQKFTITADAGYHILDVMVDNVSQGSVGEYTFTNVTSNHTISATFAIDTFTITPTTGANGSISPSSQVTVNYGDNQKITIAPGTGYHILDVMVDNVYQGSVSEYTFTNVQSNHTINATFAIDTFTITPTAGNNGSITPSSQVTVNYGDNQKFTITSDTGHHISEVLVDGSPVTITNPNVFDYTFTGVTSNHTISASFAINDYTIVSTSGAKGSISPSGSVPISHGGNQKFTIAPDTGYHILDVMVDNVSQGSVTEYTFTNVQSNHTIDATFAIDTFTITPTAGANGSIAPSSQVTVDYGNNQKFTITSDTGHHISEVLVDGSPVTITNPNVFDYTFTGVTSNHTISASFAINDYTIVSTSGAKGRISPSGSVPISHGGNQKFTIAPNTGYHILDVMVDNVSQGSVTEYTFTNVQSNHTIDATFAIDTFTITPTAGANGSIAPSSQVTVDYGNNQKFTITSDTGHHISEVLVDGSSVTVTNPSVFDYTFTGVTSNHNISASFAINDYTIVSTSGAKGSISPSGSVPISHGGNQKFIITPDTGYHILAVMVDNVSQGSVSEYTFTNVQSNHTIDATFAINDYTITATSGANGSIAPSGSVPISHGSNQKFIITADTGYHILDVMVDNVSQGSVNEYTFVNVTANHTISASFAINDYVITATSGANGSITPSGSVPISHGGNQKFIITPDTGYHILDVMVDNVSQGSVTEYTFTNVQSNHTIDATFAIDTFTITPTTGANGSISPSSQVTVNYGNNQKFTITADAGHHISEVLVDGSPVTVTNPNVFDYAFTGVTANHTISASFAINDYTIVSTSGANGSISPSGSVPVSHGGNQKFTITPDTGYHILDVIVDNVYQGSVGEYTFTNVTSNHTISVTFAIDTFTITPTSGANGSISPSTQVTVNYGDNQKFTVSSDTGHHISEVLVDGSSVTITNPNSFDYTFTGVTSNHTISASFAINDYTIVSTSGANGSISPSGSVPVSHGGNQKFTITPDTGYHILDVIVDNVYQGSVGEYTFTNVTSNHTISVTFAIDTFTITPTSGANGSISPSTQVTVNYGDNQKFTVSSDTGHHISEVLVDGSSVTITNPNSFDYTFTGVTSNHTISASFAINDYTIVSTSGANGIISPSGSVPISHGSNQKFTITPDTGYHILDVMVDNVYQGSVGEYTFTNVTSNHTISVTFAIDTFTITPTSGANGSISPSTQMTVNYGDNQKFTITAYTGHHISEVLVDGSPVTVTNPNVFDYTFTGVTANHTISASFAINDYTIVSSSGANGIISPSGSVPISHGGNQQFTIMANKGYYIAKVLVDGLPVTVSNKNKFVYTFSNVTSNHTISASFNINTYTIDVIANDGGNISPSSNSVDAEYGEDVTFLITPLSGYHIEDVIVDGESVGAISKYSFRDVDSDHTLRVIFASGTCTIISTTGDNGMINPSGSMNIDYGKDQTFIITPHDGYSIKDVKIDGLSYGAITSYTFVNVISNHTIETSFISNIHAITANATNGGTIFPSGLVTVINGASQTFTIAPADGYHTEDVIVDNQSIGIATKYDFLDVNTDHTIEVIFGTNAYIITATALNGGTIEPAGLITVKNGENLTFTITPDTGYHLAYMNLDNTTVDSANSYTIADIKANHKILVGFVANTYDIKATKNDGGTISPDGLTILNYGSSQKFTIAPDTGYYIEDVKADDQSVGVVTEYDFTNVNSNHTIDVIFAANTYTIAATTLNGGTVMPSGSVKAKHGSSQDFTIKPDEGYKIACITVDGVQQTNVSDTYLFTNVTSDHSILVVFEAKVFTIKTKSGPHGLIWPAIVPMSKEMDIPVEYGKTKQFTIAADSGYSVTDVKVDGVSLGSLTTYTFSEIKSDHTLEATFDIKKFIIKSSSGLGGEISPTGSVIVNNGSNQEFTIAPEPGYHIVDVNVDGKSVYDDLKYTEEKAKFTFTNVETNHEIKAEFGFIITATAENHGSISPNGSLKFVSGEKPKFTIIPEKGYRVVDIIIDGISFFKCLQFTGDEATYTFTALASDHTIHAVFGNAVVAGPGLTNPKQNMLLQNYPNPFNAETWIPYQLKEDSEVRISIYNISGELIRAFKLGYKSAGIYVSPDRAVYWNGKNESGEQVISGTYFYSINAGDFKAVKKFIILK